MLWWLSRHTGQTFDQIEERYSAEQVGLLYYLARKERYYELEDQSKMIAAGVATMLGQMFS